MRWVVWNQPLVDRFVQAGTQHHVDAAHSFCTQPRVRQGVFALNSATGFQVIVELLELQCTQPFKLNLANIGLDMVSNEALVLVACGFPKIWFDEMFVPAIQPLGYGVSRLNWLRSLLDFRICDGFLQLFFAFSLSLCQHVLEDLPAIFTIADRVATLPPAIFSLVDTAFAIRSALCQKITSFQARHHTT